MPELRPAGADLFEFWLENPPPEFVLAEIPEFPPRLFPDERNPEDFRLSAFAIALKDVASTVAIRHTLMIFADFFMERTSFDRCFES